MGVVTSGTLHSGTVNISLIEISSVKNRFQAGSSFLLSEALHKSPQSVQALRNALLWFGNEGQEPSVHPRPFGGGGLLWGRFSLL